MMSDPKTIERIKKAVDKRFSYYPKTKEVLDLKEELLSIMIDKYNDLETGTENQKYRECIAIMLSSYKQVLHDLEVESSRKILTDKILGFSIFSTLYFLVIVLVYILVSKYIVESFSNTYFIVLAPSILFSLIISSFIFKYCQKMRYKVMMRVSLGLIFLSIAICLYTIPCFFFMIYKGINLWHPLWLVILAVGSIYVVVDTIVYPSKKPLIRLIRICLNTLSIFTTVYLVVSILFGYWYVTWLIFVACIIIWEINVLLFLSSLVCPALLIYILIR